MAPATGGPAIPTGGTSATDSELARRILAARAWAVRQLRAAADLTRAVDLGERVLADSERILGPDHPDALTIWNNLALAYRMAGRLDKAIPIFEAALADRERVLGPDHPSTLTSRDNLAGAYRAAGQLDKAIPLHERILADRERILGPDHPETIIFRTNLETAKSERRR